jgi:rhodanese-related sulfurtransferase
MGIILMTGVFSMTSCNEPLNTSNVAEQPATAESVTVGESAISIDGYMQITQDEAKSLMDSEENYIILDVRTVEEFNESHIDGAILIPDYEINEKAEEILTDKNQLILVYCRSGRRSKLASAQLAKMGYTNVKEFGGIIDWSYGTVSG